MTAYIETYLQKIDNALKGKSKRDLNMVYIMIFATIFAFGYLLFWDSSLDNFKHITQRISILQKQISEDETYINTNPQTKIDTIQRDIESIKRDLALNQDKNSYIKSKIKAISPLLYNEKTWGAYINSVSKNAKKYGVKLITFSNTVPSSQSAFGHMLDIDLYVTSDYKNIIKFINSLEKSELVVDLHHFNIKAQERLNADLNISIWGINY